MICMMMILMMILTMTMMMMVNDDNYYDDGYTVNFHLADTSLLRTAAKFPAKITDV